MATEQNSGGFIYDPVAGTPVDKPTADNAQARWLQIDAKATSAESGSAAALATLGAVKQEATEAKTAAQQSATSASSSAAASNAAADTAERFGDDVELLKQMAEISPGSVTDAQTALLIQNPASETHTRLNAQSEQVAVEATAIRTDRGFMTMQAAVNACQPGDTLQIRNTWQIDTTITLDKSLTLQSVRGGSVTTIADVHAFDVVADSVTLDGVTIKGMGTAATGTQAGVRASGTVAAPIRGLVIRGTTITDMSKYGMDLHHAIDPVIEDCRIENIGYGAIMLMSCTGGRVSENTIRNLTQTGSWVNSYGIAMTRDSSKTMIEAPRTRATLVFGNLVEGVTQWEGIDTHGGADLTIIDNKVLNCFIGIAVVPCPDETGKNTYAPLNVRVLDNLVDSTVRDGTRRAGIQLVGVTPATGTDSVTEYATGVIRGNTVIGHGTENTGGQSGIHLQATRGAVVRANETIECSPNGIHVFHNNQGAIIDNNVIIDAWTNSVAFAACIYVSSVHNTLNIRGNSAVRASKTATLVNSRGMFFASALSSPDVTAVYEGNDFESTAAPLVDSTVNQNITEHRITARRVSYAHGVTPKPARPSITGSRGGNIALADLIARLNDLGLVVNDTTV